MRTQPEPSYKSKKEKEQAQWCFWRWRQKVPWAKGEQSDWTKGEHHASHKPHTHNQAVPFLSINARNDKADTPTYVPFIWAIVVETGYFTWVGGIMIHRKETKYEWMSLNTSLWKQSCVSEMSGWQKTRILWMSIKIYSGIHFRLKFYAEYEVLFATQRLLNFPSRGTCAGLLRQKDNWPSNSQWWWHC